MYQYEAIVRYSETGGKQCADAATIANFLQDCAILHSEDVGIGLQYLEEHHRAWFLISWQIVMSRYPDMGEKITVRTWAYDFKGSLGFRNIEILDAAGNSIVKVTSIWSYMDTLQLRPTKIEEEVAKAYPLEPKLEMEYAPRKIALLPAPCLIEERQVMEYQIDSNHHMNNSAYIALAKEYLDDTVYIKEIRAEYKKQFVKGDTIRIKKATDHNLCQIIFAGADDQVRCVVLFELEEKDA